MFGSGFNGASRDNPARVQVNWVHVQVTFAHTTHVQTTRETDVTGVHVLMVRARVQDVRDGCADASAPCARKGDMSANAINP